MRPTRDVLRPGPGRPRGSLSRWSRASLNAVFEVFDKLGGVEAMTEWARAHPSDFYRGIYARLLPTRTEVDARIDAVRSVQDMTDEELLAAIKDNPVFVSLTAPAATARNAETMTDLHGHGGNPDQEPYGPRK